MLYGHELVHVHSTQTNRDVPVGEGEGAAAADVVVGQHWLYQLAVVDNNSTAGHVHAH
jgi:hypothetical protein